jgi:LemA protein
MTVLYILLGLAVLVAGYVWLTYNSLVSLVNRAREAWSDIQVQMKRRYDLVPNLVETVKGYASQEREVLERVTRARAEAMANDGPADSQAKSENFLTGALKSLFALSEAYPDLKSNQNFLALQTELSEIEEHIQKSRRFYNGNVRGLNIKIQQFPSNLVARQFGFETWEYFELDEADAAATPPVKVDFGS